MTLRVPLNHISNVYRLAEGHTLNRFLSRLGGPAVLTFPGRDKSRCRVVVTLLHGNEPSGLRAVLRLAHQHFIPAVTCHVIVASTAAAATPPWFSHRMLPGQRDLNRCFSDEGKGEQVALAQAIKSTIALLSPECVIDLHNTSGSGPDFCVSTHNRAAHKALASHFTSWVIVTDIRLGSLMEQPLGCPVVTIEAGGAKDASADQVAYKGLINLFSTPDVFALQRDVSVLLHPRRLELKSGCAIAYMDGPDSATEVCLRTDIETLNFGRTRAGTHLGWVRSNSLAAFTLDTGATSLSDYFRVEDHCLYTAAALRLFMVTTNADIARSDCLFYFIHEQ